MVSINKNSPVMPQNTVQQTTQQTAQQVNQQAQFVQTGAKIGQQSQVKANLFAHADQCLAQKGFISADDVTAMMQRAMSPQSANGLQNTVLPSQQINSQQTSQQTSQQAQQKTKKQAIAGLIQDAQKSTATPEERKAANEALLEMHRKLSGSGRLDKEAEKVLQAIANADLLSQKGSLSMKDVDALKGSGAMDDETASALAFVRFAHADKMDTSVIEHLDGMLNTWVHTSNAEAQAFEAKRMQDWNDFKRDDHRNFSDTDRRERTQTNEEKTRDQSLNRASSLQADNVNETNEAADLRHQFGQTGRAPVGNNPSWLRFHVNPSESSKS